MTTTIDLTTVLLVIEHGKRWRITDERFVHFSCSGLGLTLMLPRGEVGLFYEWVRPLGDCTIVARRHHNQPGQLEASGTIASGHRISVLVEMDRRLLVGTKMIGRVELDRVAEFAQTLSPQAVRS